VVEQRPVTRPRRPSRQQIIVRRVLALGFLAVVIGVIVWGAVALAGGSLSGSDGEPTSALPPPPKPLKIVFPEGFTRRDMAKRITAVDRIAKRKRGVTPKLSARQYLAATKRPRRISGFGSKAYPLEGFLFPATYDFFPSTTSRQLMRTQLATFERNWKGIDLRYARSKQLTPYDVLIIASMVERETLAPRERRLVAAVIYNRLHARIPLGIDATIRYALNIPGTQSLHESQLQDPTPYNTRLHTGLPPTPIGNPGLASMRAAAHPAKVDYLYFVRKPDKVHHFFTASFTEFQNYANAHGF
jgi:peptidoglycan lytic transglycosylase G